MDDDLDVRQSQEESNGRYRRQRNLPPFNDFNSDVPDSQPPSAQAPHYPSDSDAELPLTSLRNFNFLIRAMIKKTVVSGNNVNSKDWSYEAYLIRETAKLQAVVTHRIGTTITPPQFASEMKIFAKGLTPPIAIPILVDADLTSALRAWNNVKYKMQRQECRAQLTVTFEQTVDIVSTAPQGTPNASHPERRTATNRQRVTAAANEAIAEAVGDARAAIVKHWACGDTTCRNNPKPCYVSPHHGHLPFTMRVVRDWIAWIRDGKATVEKVPPSLVLRLMKDHGKRVSPATVKSSLPQPQLPGVNLYFGGGGPGGGFFGGAASGPLASSPPGSLSGDDDENMQAYIAWLVREGHGKKEALEDAASALDDEGWGWSDLKQITKADWEKMAVPGGVVRKIMKHAKAWKKLGKPAKDVDLVAAFDNDFGDDEMDFE
jgi:hypothetical protein